MRLTPPDCHTRLRFLIDAGELPSAPPIPAAPHRPGTPADPFMRICDPRDESVMCMICLETGSEVSYVYRDGRVIRVHAACHMLWRTDASVRLREAVGEVVASSRTPRTTPSAAPRAARQTGHGCSRCGSTCTLLDDCVVCSGVTLCARCRFGSRVEEDEAHTVLALEG